MARGGSAINEPIQWPDNRSFAFTIFDDTDGATMENVPEVYALLEDLGFRTTKSVWPASGARPSAQDGLSCEDGRYLDWLLRLQELGFEIGYHMNASRTSLREATERGLQRFEELFGQAPVTMANHSSCEENIYWGPDRLTGARRLIYNMATRNRRRGMFNGHVVHHPLFWGDLCKKHVTYCRNFVFAGINTLAACPMMPYHDSKRPYVNFWFASSEGAKLESFVRLISEANQETLEMEGGCCIVYTHLACGFYDQGRVNPRFRELMERLRCKNGWFAPTREILDFLRQRNHNYELKPNERATLEWRWLMHKFRIGPS